MPLLGSAFFPSFGGLPQTGFKQSTMHSFACLLALAATTVLGGPVQTDQSPNNLELNTRQTASGCYHQYDMPRPPKR